MRVDTTDKTTAGPIVGRISAALPVIRRALRIPFPVADGDGSAGKMDAAPRQVEPSRPSAFDQPQTASDGPPWLVASFTAFVIVPIAAASIYFAFLASDQFVSELRFAVRGSTERLPGTEALGATGGLAYLNSNQEVYAIADYISSRSAVEEVGKTIDLRHVFGAGGADWLSRLEDQAPGEELLRYWKSMITVSTEAVSGLVSVEVRAFTRQDSVSLASAIRQASEALVNRMQERLRGDMVARAEDEIRIARERAVQARAEVARYRSSQATFDPLDTARSLIDTVTELKRELSALNVELASANASMGPDAPNVRTIRARRSSLLEQIQGLERQITSTNVGDRTAASLLVDYDRLEIGQALAEQQVAVAEKMFDEVRTETNRHHVYIDVIEGPTTPQSALFPKSARWVAEIAIAAMALWCIAFLTVAGVRDHAD